MRHKPLPPIDSYEFGNIVVGGKAYTQDLIILPDRVFANWWRQEGHSLVVGDLELVLHTRPEILIVGTGTEGLMDVPPDTRSAIARAGIQLIVQPTADAVVTYNRLRTEKHLAAALHLTC